MCCQCLGFRPYYPVRLVGWGAGAVLLAAAGAVLLAAAAAAGSSPHPTTPTRVLGMGRKEHKWTRVDRSFVLLRHGNHGRQWKLPAACRTAARATIHETENMGR